MSTLANRALRAPFLPASSPRALVNGGFRPVSNVGDQRRPTATPVSSANATIHKAPTRPCPPLPMVPQPAVYANQSLTNVMLNCSSCSVTVSKARAPRESPPSSKPKRPHHGDPPTGAQKVLRMGRTLGIAGTVGYAVGTSLGEATLSAEAVDRRESKRGTAKGRDSSAYCACTKCPQCSHCAFCKREM